MNSAFQRTVHEERPDERIPAELLSLPQWIAWWSVAGEGQSARLPSGRLSGVLKAQAKPHKLPINPRAGGLAATTRPATWSSVENARAAVQRWSLTGIGFVFIDSDPYTGIDIDNCRNPETEQIADWAWAIIRTLDSYTELSPSGTGIHTIVRGTLPAGKGNQAKHHDGKVEMFSRARYFTVTGMHVEGTPIEILDRRTELLALHRQLFGSRNSPDSVKESTPSSPLPASDDELIAKARQAQNGPKFEQLWNGQWQGEYPSQSEADLALCCLLAFWTGKDRARMDALFRCSGMMRKKWLREDYRTVTISRAVSCTDQTWTIGAPVRRSRSELGSMSNAKPRTVSQVTDGAASWDLPVPIHRFELPQFPSEVFPTWLREFVEAEATATQTPVDLASMLSLSVLAAACAKKVVVPGMIKQ